IPGQSKFLNQFLIPLRLPAAVNFAHHLSGLSRGKAAGHPHLVHHHADFFLEQGVLLPVLPAQNGDGSLILPQQSQQQLDGGAFPCPVLSDQPQNTTSGQGEGKSVQGKISPVLGQIPYFYGVHSSPSNAKRIISSSSVRS